MRKILFAVLIVLVVFGALAGTKILQIRKMVEAGKHFTAPPESVATALAREEKWQGTLSTIGTITAAQGVTVTTEIAGTVREIAFDSGVLVAKGDLLVRLDTSSEEAQLRAVEALVELAQLNLTREQALRAEKTVSQSDLDSAEATLKQNKANADAIRAVIEKKTIRAPFAGQLGIRQINLGQYLDSGKPIVSLQSLTPVYADFALPQQDLAHLKTGMRVHVITDAYTNLPPFVGTLTAINPDLDQSTRAVSLRATFQNPDHWLRPGMFARVEVLLPDEQTVLTIPATSVLSAPYGDSVFVVESKTGPDGKEKLAVRQQFVRIGEGRGDFTSINSGLKPGERVVSAGVFKLRNGMSIVESNELGPKPEAKPRPADS